MITSAALSLFWDLLRPFIKRNGIGIKWLCVTGGSSLTRPWGPPKPPPPLGCSEPPTLCKLRCQLVAEPTQWAAVEMGWPLSSVRVGLVCHRQPQAYYSTLTDHPRFLVEAPKPLITGPKRCHWTPSWALFIAYFCHAWVNCRGQW